LTAPWRRAIQPYPTRPANLMNRAELQKKVETIRWFHRIELGQGVITPGLANTPAKLKRLKFPEKLDGQSVLDIGAWDGFFRSKPSDEEIS